MTPDHNITSTLAALDYYTHTKQVIIKDLSEVLGCEQDDIFYSWCFRKFKQHGELVKLDYIYFFHGYECDIRSKDKSQYIRIDFGPGGRIDTFSEWGLYNFVVSFKSQNSALLSLHEYLIKTVETRSRSETSNNSERDILSELIDYMKKDGYLYQAFYEPLNYENKLNFPVDEIKYFDEAVSNRLIISTD
ncbi:hypothetical protein H0A36_09605 [Endozoicomonas sp. SM1973]|uniref:DUF6896 domain-containing protein n=1 Tax=Spartinivicinus marinus TaxID=2994442 RepID=A0A853IFI3_9GAMM|nr:hypothetical protein [Spartinivicinus marinus]MCX4024707.1 hypothetical protein [Spartinivicinus marinus]NYZ66266.1 hypothetical protein [Spartinivicinus marinus]